MKTINKPLLVKLLLVTFFLIGSVAASAQDARPARCRIFPLLKDENARSSYGDDIASFNLDGKEGETIRSFRYKDFVVTIGIDFIFDSSKKTPSPYEVRLAMIVSGKEEKEVFETPDSSEARTLYKKDWNLAVRKNVKTGNLTNMFTVSCGDGAKLPRR
jgi:hypothetical protein